MLDYIIPAEKLTELRAAHRTAHERREADRIKAVVLLASGWTAEQVAEALLVDPNTVRNNFRRYQRDGLAGLRHVAYGGSDCALDAPANSPGKEVPRAARLPASVGFNEAPANSPGKGRPCSKG